MRSPESNSGERGPEPGREPPVESSPGQEQPLRALSVRPVRETIRGVRGALQILRSPGEDPKLVNLRIVQSDGFGEPYRSWTLREPPTPEQAALLEELINRYRNHDRAFCMVSSTIIANLAYEEINEFVPVTDSRRHWQVPIRWGTLRFDSLRDLVNPEDVPVLKFETARNFAEGFCRCEAELNTLTRRANFTLLSYDKDAKLVERSEHELILAKWITGEQSAKEADTLLRDIVNQSSLAFWEGGPPLFLRRLGELRTRFGSSWTAYNASLEEGEDRDLYSADRDIVVGKLDEEMCDRIADLAGRARVLLQVGKTVCGLRIESDRSEGAAFCSWSIPLPSSEKEREAVVATAFDLFDELAGKKSPDLLAIERRIKELDSRATAQQAALSVLVEPETFAELAEHAKDGPGQQTAPTRDLLRSILSGEQRVIFYLRKPDGPGSLTSMYTRMQITLDKDENVEVEGFQAGNTLMMRMTAESIEEQGGKDAVLARVIRAFAAQRDGNKFGFEGVCKQLCQPYDNQESWLMIQPNFNDRDFQALVETEAGDGAPKVSAPAVVSIVPRSARAEMASQLLGAAATTFWSAQELGKIYMRLCEASRGGGFSCKIAESGLEVSLDGVGAPYHLILRAQGGVVNSIEVRGPRDELQDISDGKRYSLARIDCRIPFSIVEGVKTPLIDLCEVVAKFNSEAKLAPDPSMVLPRNETIIQMVKALGETRS